VLIYKDFPAANTHGVQGVASSNPAVPTNTNPLLQQCAAGFSLDLEQEYAISMRFLKQK
jgi:hypothetical protein